MAMQHHLRTLLSCAVVAGMAGVAEAQSNNQTQNVRHLGRTAPLSSGGFTIQWPSSGFEATFTGAMMTARIEDWGSNWLNVEVDGQLRTIDLNEGTDTYVLFSGPPGVHTIKVTRRTAPQVGPTTFLNIWADGPIEATAAPARRILVIGDSIVTGFGVEGADRSCRYSHATQNADLAYPALLAKAFDADLHSVSLDGGGLVRNYSDNGPAMDTLSWQRTYGEPALWPTASWRPDAVVVNLGTSDFSAGDPGDEFDASYIGLIGKIRSAWPETEIFAALGGLIGRNHGPLKSSVSSAVTHIQRQGDRKVHFVELTPPDRGRRYGCDWHPGIDAHKAMADQLQVLIESRLGWATLPQSISAQVSAGPISLR